MLHLEVATRSYELADSIEFRPQARVIVRVSTIFIQPVPGVHDKHLMQVARSLSNFLVAPLSLVYALNAQDWPALLLP